MSPRPASAAAFWLGLLAIVLLCDAWVVRSEARLPALVMTRWTADRPTSFMTRDQWIYSALVLVTGPSLLVGAGLRVTARRWPRLIDSRLAAMSPPARARLLPLVDGGSLLLAGGIALWFTAFHLIVVRANRTSPPTRETWPVVLWVVVFLVFVVGYTLVMRARLRAAGRGAGG